MVVFASKILSKIQPSLTPIKTEWSLPIPYGTTGLPQSNDPEAVPSSNGALSPSKIEEAPRQTAPTNGLKTQPPHQGDHRSGFHLPSPLWQTGDGSDRLQSQKMEASFLSSSSMFQWDHQRFLTWRTSPWQYPYRY